MGFTNHKKQMFNKKYLYNICQKYKIVYIAALILFVIFVW